MEGSPSGEGHRPDKRFDASDVLGTTLLERVLPLVTRPARYLGGEVGAACPPWRGERANILLAFPDAYEIGMSHTGLRILYALLNGLPDAFADLAFAPWPDLEKRMRAERLPLFGLASRRPARQFDVIGFSLGYELTYTNVLTMLDLSGLPLRAAERGESDPVVVAGGECVSNPTVMASFVDVFFAGDGEETVLALADAVLAWKRGGGTRGELCDRLASLPGAWRTGAGAPARPRVLMDLDRAPLPAGPLPVTETVHDRLTLEVMRGCTRGCRFCQAGMLGRPVRERSPAAVVAAAGEGLAATGWSEVSLLSLSTTDYSALDDLVSALRATLGQRRARLTLPSLRVEALRPDLYAEILREESSGFTFAPEAGTQRLRDIINKNVTEDDVLASAREAFTAGAKGLKLYFMIGLPTETDDDLHGIVSLVQKVVRLAPRGGGQVTVSLSPFAPKAHTPFQWAGQASVDEMRRRNALLEAGLRRLRVKVSLRDPEVSALEGLLGLGDARCGEVVREAWLRGARFDAWSEGFDAGRWHAACAAVGVDPAAYLAARDPELSLPWDACVAAVDRDFLVAEWARAQRGETTADCRLEGGCLDCAACCNGVEHRFAARSPGTRGVPSLSAEPPAVPTPSGVAEAAPVFDPRNASREDPARERRRWSVWRGLAASRCWYRAEYTKLDSARFLGHLDFQRLLQLALRRADLPIAYSQGFHPHPLLRFGPPLPVGAEGERELLDVAFSQQLVGWEQRLNAVLPAGVRMLRSEPSGPLPPRAIESAADRCDYLAVLPPPSEGGPAAAALAARVADFLASTSWPFTRVRPKGDVEIDIRPCVPEGGLTLAPTHSGLGLRFSLTRQEGPSALPAYDFLVALCGDLLTEPRLCRVRRTGMSGRTDTGRWLTPLAEIGEANRRLWLRARLCA